MKNQKIKNTARTRTAIYRAFGFVNFIRGKVLSIAADYAVNDPTGAQAANIAQVVEETYSAHEDIIDKMWEVWGYPLRLNSAPMERATRKAFTLLADVTGLSAVFVANEMLTRELDKVRDTSSTTASWILARLERSLEPCKQFIEDYEFDTLPENQ